MSNTDDVWDAFDLVVILTVSDQTTEQRLSTRVSGEFGSTQVNRGWVLSWKNDLENRWLKMGGMQMDAEASPEIVAQAIIELIRAETVK
jgi:hypothetical protein